MSSIVTLAYAKHEIVTPALTKIGLASPAAINLVTGIGLAESGYRTRRQVGGPALGFWQMEPATEQDCWTNFLDYRPLLAALVCKLSGRREQEITPQLLLNNDLYAAAMCRVKLYRSPKPLPSATCALALSLFHKEVYNTSLGKADPYQNVRLFQEAINA